MYRRKGKQLMRTQRLAIVITVLNMGLLLALGFPGLSVHAQTTPDVLRARAIELVDAVGQVRAALTVESNGEAVFRLRDANGTIRVKLGASEEGSALLLIDGATEPGAHILSRRTETTFTLRGKDGQPRQIRP